MRRLMGPLAGTLLAISAGAVFMGANRLYRQCAEFHGQSMPRRRASRCPVSSAMIWSFGIWPLFVW